MPSATAEVWDAGTATFALLADTLDTARSQHEAVLLPNGKVLITGGRDAAGDSLASAELFDPETGLFSAAGAMTRLRGPGHTLSLLPSGKVLIAGGWDPVSGSHIVESEVFDPGTGNFTTAESLISGRASHTSTLLDDGRVLIVGGETDTGALASAEVYRPGR